MASATVVLGAASMVAAQAKPATPPARILVHAGRLVDGDSDKPRSDQGILIEGDKEGRRGVQTVNGEQ
jgi:hypothetical protein